MTQFVARDSNHHYDAILTDRGQTLAVYDHTQQPEYPAATILLSELRAHNDVINCVAVSPNGAFIATGAGAFDPTIKVWSSSSPQLLLTLVDHSNWINAVAWAPSSRMLLSASADSTVKQWTIISNNHDGATKKDCDLYGGDDDSESEIDGC